MSATRPASRRSATLAIEQAGTEVVATVTLQPPGITRLVPPIPTPPGSVPARGLP